MPPPQSAHQTRKLLAFVAVVITGVIVLWQANRAVRDREAALEAVGTRS